MLQVISQHIQQIHDLRLIVDQRQHDHTKSILQLCMLVQLIQNNIGIGILTKLNDNADTFTVGFITDIRDTIDLFQFYQLGNLDDQIGLVDHVRQLSSNDLTLAVWKCLNIGHCTDSDLTTTGTIGFFTASGTQDQSSGRKIGSFYNGKNLINRCISVFFHTIINNFYDSLYHFTEIVRRNISSHTYGNTGSTVDQQIRITTGQYYRLFFGIIKVRYEIYGILADICQ